MAHRYRPEELTAFAVSVGRALGMLEKSAQDFGESLVYADMRGLGSHGLMRLPTYAKRLQMGLVCPDAIPRATQDGGALLAVDGQNGIGICVAQTVMEWCVERALELGICVGAVRNCNHFGCAAYFTEYAAKQHMIGFAMGNAFRSVAPFGGARPMLGTNPLSVAIPAAGRGPFLLDMATSVVAQGKILFAQKEKHPIPLGWGVDKHGIPTMDPNAVLDGGSLITFGGAKGYGISLMIELLCACLANAADSTEMGSLYDFTRTQDTGFIIGAIHIGQITASDIFEISAARLLDRIKNTTKSAQTAEILIPGEIEERKYQTARRDGVELPETVWRELTALGADLNIPFPKELPVKGGGM